MINKVDPSQEKGYTKNKGDTPLCVRVYLVTVPRIGYHSRGLINTVDFRK